MLCDNSYMRKARPKASLSTPSSAARPTHLFHVAPELLDLFGDGGGDAPQLGLLLTLGSLLLLLLLLMVPDHHPHHLGEGRRRMRCMHGWGEEGGYTNPGQTVLGVGEISLAGATAQGHAANQQLGHQPQFEKGQGGFRSAPRTDRASLDGTQEHGQTDGRLDEWTDRCRLDGFQSPWKYQLLSPKVCSQGRTLSKSPAKCAQQSQKAAEGRT